MNMLGQDPALPLWAVGPPAALVMLFLAGHIMAMAQAQIDARRRRIRSANGVLMMLTTALLAQALAVVSPADTRTFVLVWMMIITLLGLTILLALADAFNSVVLHRQELRQTRIAMHPRRPLGPCPVHLEPEQTDA